MTVPESRPVSPEQQAETLRTLRRTLSGEHPNFTVIPGLKVPFKFSLDAKTADALEAGAAALQASSLVSGREGRGQEHDDGAELIGRAIPDVAETEPRLNLEQARVAAYRAARLFEPSMEGYAAAMAVYEAAFGKHPGEITFDPESPQGSSVLQHSAWTKNSFLNWRDEFREKARRARKRFSERHSHYGAAQHVASVYNDVAEMFQSRIDALDNLVGSHGNQSVSETSGSAQSDSAKENKNYSLSTEKDSSTAFLPVDPSAAVTTETLTNDVASEIEKGLDTLDRESFIVDYAVIGRGAGGLGAVVELSTAKHAILFIRSAYRKMVGSHGATASHATASGSAQSEAQKTNSSSHPSLTTEQISSSASEGRQEQKNDKKDLGGDERPQRSIEPSPVGEGQLPHVARVCVNCRHFEVNTDWTIVDGDDLAVNPAHLGWCGNQAVPIACIWIRDASKFGCNFHQFGSGTE